MPRSGGTGSRSLLLPYPLMSGDAPRPENLSPLGHQGGGNVTLEGFGGADVSCSRWRRPRSALTRTTTEAVAFRAILSSAGVVHTLEMVA